MAKKKKSRHVGLKRPAGLDFLVPPLFLKRKYKIIAEKDLFVYARIQNHDSYTTKSLLLFNDKNNILPH